MFDAILDWEKAVVEQFTFSNQTHISAVVNAAVAVANCLVIAAIRILRRL